MDKKYLQDVAERRVAIVWAKAQSIYLATVGQPVPAVKINARLKTTAGLAYSLAHRVEFCAQLMWEHTEQFIRDTIPHEVAHIVTDMQYPGARSHGPEWRSVMKTLSGIEATRCHQMVNSEWELAKANRAK